VLLLALRLALDCDARQGGLERARRDRPPPELGDGHHPLYVPSLFIKLELESSLDGQLMRAASPIRQGTA
jgi:hypothetical protein